MSKEKITIIDGSSYIFRAYFAIQHLSNSKRFPTNAILGFTNMLIRALEVEKPTRLVIAFDTPTPSFRKKMYPEYKANREKPPEDLILQIPYIFKAVDGFGIRRIEAPGYEADDVIGTMSKKAVEDGFKVEIITGDKDLMQLVNDDVNLYDTMRDKRTDSAGVVERFGVRPDQIVDFLGLMETPQTIFRALRGLGKKPRPN